MYLFFNVSFSKFLQVISLFFFGSSFPKLSQKPLNQYKIVRKKTNNPQSKLEQENKNA